MPWLSLGAARPTAPAPTQTAEGQQELACSTGSWRPGLWATVTSLAAPRPRWLGPTGEWKCLGPHRPQLACRLLREPPSLLGLWAPDALALSRAPRVLHSVLGDAGWLWSACLHPVLRQPGDEDPEVDRGLCTLCMGREAKPGL